MNTKKDQSEGTMSFSLWALACGVIPKTKEPGGVSPPGPDASAIQGRLGAQVALPQSLIPRAAPTA